MFEHHSNRTPQHIAGTGLTQPPWRHFSELDLLRLALNQVDYGVVVVEVGTAAIQFANALGRDALAGGATPRGASQSDTGLCLAHGRLAARRQSDAAELRRTLERTRVGVRGLLSLGAGAQSCAVAVVPLVAPPAEPEGNTAPTAGSHALLLFAKKQLCDDSTVALFARSSGLTSAEGQVLAHICRGLRPAQIANHHGVRISTVRSQLRSIRQKTCSQTIRDLVHKVSVLPPMARQLSSGTL
jgi:DNA-binding CsgD family transcriptional regulator